MRALGRAVAGAVVGAVVGAARGAAGGTVRRALRELVVRAMTLGCMVRDLLFDNVAIRNVSVSDIAMPAVVPVLRAGATPRASLLAVRTRAVVAGLLPVFFVVASPLLVVFMLLDSVVVVVHALVQGPLVVFCVGLHVVVLVVLVMNEV